MKNNLTVSQIVDFPKGLVWDLFNDFPNVYRFNPNVKKSYSLNKQRSGIGAERQCDLYQKNQWIKERIIDQVDGEMIKIDAYESSMPIKNPRATLYFKEKEYKTEIIMEMGFDNKIPIIGSVIAHFMIKPMMTRMLNNFLIGVGKHLESGQIVTNKTNL